MVLAEPDSGPEAPGPSDSGGPPCEVIGAASLPWELGGTAWTGTTSTTTWTDDTIPVSALFDDDVWTCTTTPDDATTPAPPWRRA